MPMGGGMAGFLQSFTQTAGQQIDKQHAAEEEKKRRIREDQWKILSQYQADPGAFDPEFIKQTQQEFLKGLNGESKKSAVKVFGIFDKFRSGNKQQGQGQQQPQQGQTQKQQGGPLQPPQPQAAASPQPAAQGSAGPLQPPQGQPKAAGGPLQPPQAAAAPPQGGAPPQAPAAAPAQPEAQPPQNGPRMFRTPEERDATEAAARQQRITALKKEAEDQFGLKGRDAADYVNAHMGAKELPREAAAPKPTALDLMKQVEGILADPNAPEADKKAAQDIKDAHAVKSTNKKFVWGKRPGSDTAVLAYTDPKDPKGFYDPETNEKIDGFTPGATPQTQRLYGAVLGYYYKFLGQNNPATGKPYSDTEAREKAGQMFTEREGIHLGRVEQQAQIDGALSGISIGPGFSGTSERDDTHGATEVHGGAYRSKASRDDWGEGRRFRREGQGQYPVLPWQSDRHTEGRGESGRRAGHRRTESAREGDRAGPRYSLCLADRESGIGQAVRRDDSTRVCH